MDPDSGPDMDDISFDQVTVALFAIRQVLGAQRVNVPRGVARAHVWAEFRALMHDDAVDAPTMVQPREVDRIRATVGDGRPTFVTAAPRPDLHLRHIRDEVVSVPEREELYPLTLEQAVANTTLLLRRIAELEDRVGTLQAETVEQQRMLNSYARRQSDCWERVRAATRLVGEYRQRLREAGESVDSDGSMTTTDLPSNDSMWSEGELEDEAEEE